VPEGVRTHWTAAAARLEDADAGKVGFESKFDPNDTMDHIESGAASRAPKELAVDSVLDAGMVRENLPLSESDRQRLEEIRRQEKELKTNQVLNAASLVINALHDGPWPSPVRRLDPTQVADRTDEEDTAHRRHLSMASASIQQFARDVIVPAMLAEEGDPRKNSHVFLGTLLILREIMTQNALTIFGESALLTGNENDFIPGAEEVLQYHGFEEDSGVFSAQVLATSVILTGLESLEFGVARSLSTEFLRMVEKYDGGEQEVVSALDRVDPEVGVLLPNGAEMGEAESLAWQVSFK